jgi:hypothetical protein
MSKYIKNTVIAPNTDAGKLTKIFPSDKNLVFDVNFFTFLFASLIYFKHTHTSPHHPPALSVKTIKKAAKEILFFNLTNIHYSISNSGRKKPNKIKTIPPDIKTKHHLTISF